MNRKRIKNIMGVILLISVTQSFSKVGNRILIQGMLTKSFADYQKGFVLIEDNFKQKFLWSIKHLKETTKIDPKRTPASVLFEVDFETYQKVHEDCIQKFKDHPMKKNCPINLLKKKK